MVQLIKDIWFDFRALPLWVQFWVAAILVPVNLAAIFFVGGHHGYLIAFLAIGGMFPNVFIMYAYRGFPRVMAVPHLFFWIPLRFILWPQLDQNNYALLLFGVNAISLCFDIKDSWDIWRAR